MAAGSERPSGKLLASEIMYPSFLRRKRELSHEGARERLSPYVDHRLSADETAELERHLRDCEACRAELRALQMTRQMLRALPLVRIPRSFTLQSVPKPARLPRSFFLLRTATATALAAFVVLMVLPALLPMAGAPMADTSATQPTPALQAPVAERAAAPRKLSEPAASAPLPEATAPAMKSAPAAPAAAPPAPTPAPAARAAPAAAPALAAARAAPTPDAPAGAPPADEPAALAAVGVETEQAPADQPQLEAAQQPAAGVEAARDAEGVRSQHGYVGQQPPTTGVAAEAPAAQRVGEPISLVPLLQALVGGLAAALALATGVIWGTHRSRHRRSIQSQGAERPRLTPEDREED